MKTIETTIYERLLVVCLKTIDSKDISKNEILSASVRIARSP